ncbi:MAG TPA: TetR/AcrR family transcriptional regulator [Pseudonocardiaceae bacterium]|nr:TetR/AcrR family transcriptional regulator [Pseudonocardiaceae bacterium]
MRERDSVRDRIVRTAAALLDEQGVDAVTTRAVAQAAGVQPPALYRLFADKDALLDAVVQHIYAEFVDAKQADDKQTDAEEADPVAALRAGWRAYIDFGLANPAAFALAADPMRAHGVPALRHGLQVLAARVHRIAAAGRLRVDEQRAVDLVHAAGTGVLVTLLSQPPDRRDPGIADAMYDALTAAILTDTPALPAHDTTAAVTAFRALAPRLPQLSPSEAALLDEWLRR